MNVFPIDRRNKCLVQSKCDVVRNTISNVFDVFDGPSLLNGRLEILHHHLQKTAPLNHVVSSLLELLKEGLFLRDQSKQHLSGSSVQIHRRVTWRTTTPSPPRHAPNT